MVTATLRLEVSGRSDPGVVRRDNEDGFLVADLRNGSEGYRDDFSGLVMDSENALLVVADGMGGAAAGEVASRMALDQMRDWFRRRSPGNGLSATEAETLLHQAIKTSNSAVYEHAANHPGLRGMGTTLTCSWIQGDRGSFAQIGDSRAYLVREGEMRLLTQDQSLRQHLLSVGKITPEQAERMEDSNVILQALGVNAAVSPVITRLGLRPGDLLLLCSDGLNAGVDDPGIARVLLAATDRDAAADELVACANANGGPDNITVVLARVHAAAEVEPSEGRPVARGRATRGDETQELVSISGEYASVEPAAGDQGDGADDAVGSETAPQTDTDEDAQDQAEGGAGTEPTRRRFASGFKKAIWAAIAVAALAGLWMVIRWLQT